MVLYNVFISYKMTWQIHICFLSADIYFLLVTILTFTEKGGRNHIFSFTIICCSLFMYICRLRPNQIFMEYLAIC